MTWKRGQSGNPKGRPRVGQSLREALRRRLLKPEAEAPDRTLFDRWADELINGAFTLRDRLDVIRFLEGPHPTEPVPIDDIEAKPRIRIPGSPGHKGRPKAASRARKRKPPA